LGGIDAETLLGPGLPFVSGALGRRLTPAQREGLQTAADFVRDAAERIDDLGLAHSN
jgi:hypothetical protein